MAVDVIDRVPTKPGRMKITHENGTNEYVTIEYADEPTVQGTPINKALFQDIAPAGYGVGEHVYTNRISNPLDLSLRTGIYGFTTYQGTVYNSPLPNMLGHIEVYAVAEEWHYVRAVDHDSGTVFINRYDGNDAAWTGWKQIDVNGTVLWEGSLGAGGIINLSDDITMYNKIEVCYTAAGGVAANALSICRQLFSLYSTNQNSFFIQSCNVGPEGFSINSAILSVYLAKNKSQIKVESFGYRFFPINGSTITAGTYDTSIGPIVKKIIGYK